FPIASLSGPSDGVRYQPRDFTLTATDSASSNPDAVFVFTIDWGDGTTDTISGRSGTPASHVYVAAGAYTVTATAADMDGVVSAPASQAVAIGVVQQQGADLAVGGTNSGDTLLVRKGPIEGTLEVVLDGASLGTFPVPNTFLFYGGDGDDRTSITVRLPAT